MKLKHNNFQKFLEAVTLLLLLTLCVYIALSWDKVPDKIPTHFNAAGAADDWGGKSGIIILPIINLFLYLLLTVVAFLPQAWNIPVKITEENKEYVYSSIKTLLIWLKLLITIAFSYIAFSSMNNNDISVWFLPLFLFSVFGTIIFSLIKLSAVRKTYISN